MYILPRAKLDSLELLKSLVLVDHRQGVLGEITKLLHLSSRTQLKWTHNLPAVLTGPVFFFPSSLPSVEILGVRG
jgi:hypothetical protein